MLMQPLIGREAEVAQVTAWLESLRLITLVGTGGIGKTRLAQEIAQGYRHGVVWVALEEFPAIAGEDFLLARLGEALELPECPPSEWHTRLDTLLPGPTLVVLDSLEHLLSGVRQISALLHRHPQLRVLATSRAPLRLSGEQLLQVNPLTVSLAARLFEKRAQAVRPEFALTPETQPIVEELCGHLDGIPLCLELAAARLRHLSLPELNRGLIGSLELLSGGDVDRPLRQQTLENTLDWSYQLLEPGPRQLLGCVSVFAGGFTRPAAQAVFGGEVLTPLLTLVDQSLVLAGERYRLLETVQNYAARRQPPDCLERHASYYLELAESLHAGRGGTGHSEGLRQLAEEHRNLWLALNTLAATPAGLRLAGALGWYFEACSLLEEGRKLYESFLERGSSSPLLLVQLATLLRHQGHYAQAAEHYARALPMEEASLGLGELSFRQGQYAEAREHFALAPEVESLNGLGRVAWAVGQEAEPLLQQSLALAEKRGFMLGAARAHNSLGELFRSRKERTPAARHFRAAAQLFGQLHEFSLSAMALQNLAYIELSLGQLEGARKGFLEALALWRQAGARHGLALCLIGLAGVLQDARFLGAAEVLLQSVGVKLEASDRQDQSDIQARLRSKLGERFAVLFAEGQSASLEDLLGQLRQPAPLEGLTARELEVLRVTATGASNQEVAETLTISPQTVMVHLRTIYRKLGVTSRTAAAHWAVQHGLLPEVR